MKNTFTISLAGIAVEIQAQYDKVYQLCKDYRTDEQAKYSVVITEKDIAFEREKNKEYFSDAYLETLAVYRKIVTLFVDENILLIHGSAISLHQNGYLFIAPSGTGKSTHSRLWRETFKEAVMINDDKPLLCFEGDAIYICGTPWNGKHGLGNPIKVKLRGICVLEQGKENKIIRLCEMESRISLLKQIYRPIEDTHKMEKTLDLLNQLLKVPVYKMQCTISKEAAKLSYAIMKEG